LIERNDVFSQEEEKEEKLIEVQFDLPDKDVLKLALLAHEKDVTLNAFINDVLRQGIKRGEYRFEQDTRPQLLNEAE
tara:strand:- start:2044 stop:2274 length:231 start_codon:yes stop_codon:yes gene_type:complete